MHPTEKQVLTTVIGVLLTPYLTRIGVPQSALPVLAGLVAGAVPIAYHAVSALVTRRLGKPGITPEQLAAALAEIQKLTPTSA